MTIADAWAVIAWNLLRKCVVCDPAYFNIRYPYYSRIDADPDDASD